MKNTNDTNILAAEALPEDNTRSLAPVTAVVIHQGAAANQASLGALTQCLDDVDNGIEQANKLFNRGAAIAQEMQDIQLKAVGSIAALGCHLTRLQDICPHGSWGKLFKKANGFCFSQQTAKKYMAAYGHVRSRALEISSERADALDVALRAAVATNMGQVPYMEDLTNAASTHQLFIEAGLVNNKIDKMKDKMEIAANFANLTPESAQRGMASSLSMLQGMFKHRAALVPRSFNLELAATLRAEADRLESIGI